MPRAWPGQKSILDFVNQDCVALKDLLGTEGTRLLDDHCTSVRSLEQKLQSGMTTLGAECSKPAQPQARDWANADNIDAQMASFIDLAAMTLTCEISHVIGFQFGPQAARNGIATKYGVPSSPLANSNDSGPLHHPWTHQGGSPEKTKALRLFYQFYSNQVALLVDKLKATKDAHGNPLLDSTVVLWLSELGGSRNNQDQHQTGDSPAVLIGRGQGVFKTGRYLRGKSGEYQSESTDKDQEAGRDMARLLVSMIHYMGFPDVKAVGKTDIDGPLYTLYA